MSHPIDPSTRFRLVSQFTAACLLVISIAVVAQTAQETEPQHAATNIIVTLAPDVPARGSISTATQREQQLVVQNGHSASLTRRTGRDYELQARGGLTWTQVSEVPINAEALSLAPTLLEDGRVSVVVSMTNHSNQRGVSFNTTLLVQPGEWVKLYGEDNAGDAGNKVYSTRRSAADQMFIRVDY